MGWFGWGGYGYGRGRRGRGRGGWGFGAGFGCGRGWGGPGWGRGWSWGGPGWGAMLGWPLISSAASRGYYYVGPCRSGLGPFAFYITPDGRLVHAWQVYGTGVAGLPAVPPFPFPGILPATPTSPSSAPLPTDMDSLLRERDYLRRQLEEIDRRLRELEGGV